VIDILAVRNGELVAFEIKAGGSEYLASQIAKDVWMARIGIDYDGLGVLVKIPTILIQG